jgi:hypothetical protein
MSPQVHLSDQEWHLLQQLLETERRELVSAIHRCNTHQGRVELHEREKLVTELIARLRATAVAA